MHLHLRLRLQLQPEVQKGWLQFNLLPWEHWPLDFCAWSTHSHFLRPADPRCRYLGFRPRPLPPIFQCQEKIEADDSGFKDSIETSEKRISASQNNCNFHHLPKRSSNFQCPICLAVLSWTWFPSPPEVLRSSSAPPSTNSSTCIEKQVTPPVKKYSISWKQKNISDSNLHEKVSAKPRKIDRLDCFDKTSEICIPTCATSQQFNQLAQKLDASHFVKFAEFQRNSGTIDDDSRHISIDRGKFVKSRGQCICGYDGMSCAPDCTFCCALECATANPEFDNPWNSQNQGSQLKSVSSLAAHSCETSGKDTIRDDFSKVQCRCGPDEISCAADCDYCCALNCTSSNIRLNDKPSNKCLSKGQEYPRQCVCGSDKMSCASSCEFCCAINCNAQTTLRNRNTLTKKTDENRSNTVPECVSLLSTELNKDKGQTEKRIKKKIQSPDNSKEKINIENT